MKVNEWMTKDVCSCQLETNMEQAARLMWEHDCGFLPVVGDRGKVVGAVTDRDLCMGAYTQGKALRELPVKVSMSKKVFCCKTTDPVEQAIRVMGDHGVRRVPVVDEEGKLEGILSLNDLFRRMVALSDSAARANLSSRLIEAMAAVCEPRHNGVEALEPVPAPVQKEKERVVAKR
jgi:CBS domain-containing protein